MLNVILKLVTKEIPFYGLIEIVLLMVGRILILTKCVLDLDSPALFIIVYLNEHVLFAFSYDPLTIPSVEFIFSSASENDFPSEFEHAASQYLDLMVVASYSSATIE